MRANIRELHRRTGAVVDRVVHGDVILIEKRGVPVAEIRPVRPSPVGFPAEHWEAQKRYPQFDDDSGRFISESRDRG